MSASSWLVWSLGFLVIAQVGGRMIDSFLRRTLRHRYTLQLVYPLHLLLIINLMVIATTSLLAGIGAIMAVIGFGTY